MVAPRDDRLKSLVELVSAHLDAPLRLVEVAELGETAGAAYVAWPDGHPGVLTLATVPYADMRRTADVVNGLHDAGLPFPRHEAVVELADGTVAVLQERLPGTHPAVVDAEMIDLLVAAADRFSGLLRDRPDVPRPTLELGPQAPPSRRAALEQHSARSRRLLRRIEVVGAGAPAVVGGDDLVHPDLTVSNVLLQGGRLTGIVDWNNGAYRGDRRFSLVKLLFDLAWEAIAPDGGRHGVRPQGIDRLRAVLHATVPPDLLRAYSAHWTLKMLDWTIGLGDAEAVDLHLRLGEEGLSG